MDVVRREEMARQMDIRGKGDSDRQLVKGSGILH
jgi:hypothetical protein